MRRHISLLLAFVLCTSLIACGNKNEPLTRDEVKTAIEVFLEPQIQAYEEAFGIDDLSIDIQFKKCEISEPLREGWRNTVYHNGYVSCQIRDIIVSPTFSESLSCGEFTDDMVHQLSMIEFEYPDFEYGDYKISAYSALAYPIFSDAEGNEYTIGEGCVLKGDIIAYISSDAQLAYDAKVGDNIYSVIGYSGSSDNGSSKTKCLVCNGTGYVRYYYGSSDLEAYLDGYDPYSIGECPSCDGKGY